MRRTCGRRCSRASSGLPAIFGFREEPAEFATRADFYKQLVGTFEQLTPLVRFLNEPIVAMQRTANRAHILEH